MLLHFQNCPEIELNLEGMSYPRQILFKMLLHFQNCPEIELNLEGMSYPIIVLTDLCASLPINTFLVAFAAITNKFHGTSHRACDFSISWCCSWCCSDWYSSWYLS